MTHKDVTVGNDFGEVVWTEEYENALRLMEEGAWTLQMTVGEFVETMAASQRQCPCCKH